MALEAVVYPQDPFSYVFFKDAPFHDLYFPEEEDRDPQDTKNKSKLDQEQGQGFASTSYNVKRGDNSDDHSYYKEDQLQQAGDNFLYGSAVDNENQSPPLDVAAGGGRRRNRRRNKSSKNKEEIENQRMNHIAVERNRRKQMNEYLAVLRSLMPPSYAKRGDQASIVGGAINYLKELEHHLQSMEPPVAEDTAAGCDRTNTIAASSSAPFSEYIAFPQYSSQPSSSSSAAEGRAEIEVTMVEGHASLKVLAKKRPKQLLKLVASIQNLRLTLLHLNVSNRDKYVLYNISVQVEEESKLITVEDIAAAVNQILRRIEEESSLT